jgi:hypothetical protein
VFWRLGVLVEGGAAAADHLGQILTGAPCPRRAQDVEHSADVARPTADQEHVHERRKPIAAVAFEQSEGGKCVEQNPRPALVGADGGRDRDRLVVPGGDLIENSQLQPGLQDRGYLKTLGHLEQRCRRQGGGCGCDAAGAALTVAKISFAVPTW